MIEYRKALTMEEKAAALALREEVFVAEQGVPREIELDALDEQATHILAMRAGKPVACGRLLFAGEVVKIGRIAVRRELRGRGIGRALMEYILELVAGGGKTIKLNSQLSVVGFYRKLGFIPRGEVFLEAGIKHLSMVYAPPAQGGGRAPGRMCESP